MHELFKTYSGYNHWMNGKLYAVCEAIPDAARKEDRGAFFRSVHGTLNHLLLADRLWLGRFKQEPFAIRSLDQELYSDFAELRAERETTDQDIIAWVNDLTPADLDAVFKFSSFVKQQEHAMRLRDVLLHFFNHQTHHRGQLTTLLSQLGYDFGVTDLIWMPGVELPR